MHNRWLVTASFLAVLFAVVATIGTIGSGARAQSSGNAPCTSPAASPAVTPSASPASTPISSSTTECGTPIATASAALASLTVEAHEFYFAPNMITVAAHTKTTLTIKNAGAIPHDFFVEGLNVKTAVIPPGTSINVTIDAAPGSYQFYCNLPGHRFSGMTGTLIVK